MTDLKALATQALKDSEAATPGPWGADRSPAGYSNVLLENGTLIMSGDSDPRCWPDAAFIAASRTALPALARGYLDLTQQLADARQPWAQFCRDENLDPGTTPQDVLSRLADMHGELAQATSEIKTLRKMKGVDAWADATRAKAQLVVARSAEQDLTRDRDEYKQQHDNALASWAADRKNLEDAAHRSRCDLLDAQAEIDRLRMELRDRAIQVEDRGNSFAESQQHLADAHAERDAARAALTDACALAARQSLAPSPCARDIAALRTRGGV